MFSRMICLSLTALFLMVIAGCDSNPDAPSAKPPTGSVEASKPTATEGVKTPRSAAKNAQGASPSAP
jgi:hypothetical protein